MVTNNQINTAKPIGVEDGGTGNASFTAYSIIAAGTTSTAPLQSAGTGAAGQWYVSNGNDALGTFKNLKVNVQFFSSSGTYTPTSGMVYCEIQCLGGGGGGGGAAATSSTTLATGGGGGAAEYAVGIFSAATIGASQSVTIGSGGTGVVGSTGNSGGTSSVGSLISCVGGSGGTGGIARSTGTISLGGSGGTGGTGGDYRTPGGPGFPGMTIQESVGYFTLGAQGANSQLGSGGNATFVTGAGLNAGGYGAGGGASTNLSGFSANAGGNGSSGAVIIKEFIIS